MLHDADDCWDRPGIIFDIYSDPTLPYPIPGPAVYVSS